MAGGTWTAQNKVRPGAYINFKAVPAYSSNLGTRGVMTMPVALTWGPQKEVIELFSTDLVDGKSLAKIGYSAADAESLIFRQALSNCYKAYIYRLDVGGNKATVTSGGLTATAKYPGTSGNQVSFAVVANVADSSVWDVVTYFKGAEKDRQVVSKTGAIADLKSNAFIDWSGSIPTNAVAAVKLVDGANGTVSADTFIAEDGYLNKIKAYSWNTMAIPQDDNTITTSLKTSIVAFIRGLRDDEGKKVQVVLHNDDSNYEAVISTQQGYKTADETVDPFMFTAYVAGLTAGSEVNISNTYKVIDGAVGIVYKEGVGPFYHKEIVEMLAKGQLVLTTRQDGAVVIEQDINTLHNPYPTPDVNYTFSKNRVIRTLDAIGNEIANLFEVFYIGKYNNNETGRSVFKADIIHYFFGLQELGAIQDFDPELDVVVEQGEAIDSVVVSVAVQPVDSMEKLYMTVNVQ